ncbi:hypothetical protein [Fodinibius halophilus]|uniref:Uncharacterized protein n=1 Tax=Fodinibius halophilus TaxID=1736908 RepID=A0A6M1TGG1_9BACT|nr:hypothetical protein [Fodinibius halophilus]NGP87740.1 hypothetical protein [Fodinibius halophilus]
MIAVLLFIIGFQFIYETPENISTETNIQSMEGGNFLRFVFIGSSSCVYSNSEETHNMVIELKEYFKKLANKNDLKFLTTGISKDIHAEVGTKYLQKTKPYDEIIAGASWYNLGISHYVWDVIQGEAATPQIVITKTKYKKSSTDASITRKEDLLHRSVGIQDIRFLHRLSKKSKNKEIQEMFNNSL